MVPVLAVDFFGTAFSRALQGVLTHGFAVDPKGRKMSKSIGNVIAQEVMDKLGADVLRLWIASQDFTKELTVSDEILKRTSDGYRRIRNTSRFMLANLSGFDPAEDRIEVADMVALDRWIWPAPPYCRAKFASTT